jgi:hypothetical protein
MGSIGILNWNFEKKVLLFFLGCQLVKKNLGFNAQLSSQKEIPSQ